MSAKLNTKMQNVVTLLIDGNNALHRANWVANASKISLTNSKGQETGTLFTFLKIVKTLTKQFNASDTYIAWDRKLTYVPNFRKALTDGAYKGNRDQERNKEVYSSMDPVVEMTTALGLKNIYPGKLEADDVISWLCKNIEGKKMIVSVDNDFAQLVSPEVSFYNPIKKVVIDITNFEEYFNLSPKAFLFYKAIVGDTSDNVKGIEGFGKVKGTKLAKAFVENDETLTNPFKEQVQNNLKIVDLSYGLQEFPEECECYKEQLSKLKEVKPDFNAFTKKCEEYEFKSIINDISSWKKDFNKAASNAAIVDFCKLFE